VAALSPNSAWHSEIPQNCCWKNFHLGFAAHRNQAEIIEGISHLALQCLPDGIFGLIYVDAAHDYDSVRQDALLVAAKLRPDGYLVFNDYTMSDHLGCVPYGVVPAVNELVVAGPWRVTGFALQQHMFCDIALRRSAAFAR
jgi:hypothetical protein